jgi:hypothetical protein
MRLVRQSHGSRLGIRQIVETENQVCTDVPVDSCILVSVHHGSKAIRYRATRLALISTGHHGVHNAHRLLGNEKHHLFCG